MDYKSRQEKAPRHHGHQNTHRQWPVLLFPLGCGKSLSNVAVFHIETQGRPDDNYRTVVLMDDALENGVQNGKIDLRFLGCRGCCYIVVVVSLIATQS